MPRARSKTNTRKSTSKKTATAKRTAAPRAAGSSSLVCPECGKTFTRAASLGAHRNRAHGVAGASGRTPARRRKTAGQGSSLRRPQSGRVNRDALLVALFPNGIPARESVIRDVNAWLDQAEKLARLG